MKYCSWWALGGVLTGFAVGMSSLSSLLLACCSPVSKEWDLSCFCPHRQRYSVGGPNWQGAGKCGAPEYSVYPAAL